MVIVNVFDFCGESYFLFFYFCDLFILVLILMVINSDKRV